MDAFSDPATHTVAVMSSAQVGKTEVILNVIGYHIDHDPSPMLIVEPTIDVGKSFSKDRLSTMIRDTAALSGKVRDARSRDAENTVLHKRFDGGHITIAGANSAASLRARPIRIVLADDIDAFPASAGTEGDPIDLAMKRTTTFWNRKIGLFSTPTIDGASRIDMAYKQSDRRKYHIPCPHCGEMQVMAWEQLKWPKGEPLKAVYHCISCDGLIADADKARAIRRGEWRAEEEFNGIAGFWINELYSPWVSFADMAQRWMHAHSNRDTLQVFKNTSLAETWKMTVLSKSEDDIFKARIGIPPQIVPETAVALTCGIDCQKAGFYFCVRAWTRDGSSWLIHYGFLGTWAEVETLLFDTEYPKADGSGSMRIWRAAIDTGGGRIDAESTMTDDAYFWLIKNAFRGVHIWGTKGTSHPIAGHFKPGEELLKTPSGKKLPPQFRIYLIDTDAMKDVYHQGIEAAGIQGPRALYLHRDTGDDYAVQVLAEEKRIDTKTKAVEWVRIRADNHYLDAEILCISLAQPQWFGGGVNLLRGPGGKQQEEGGSGGQEEDGRRPSKQPAPRKGWFRR